jgi:hypothetical protein
MIAQHVTSRILVIAAVFPCAIVATIGLVAHANPDPVQSSVLVPLPPSGLDINLEGQEDAGATSLPAVGSPCTVGIGACAHRGIVMSNGSATWCSAVTGYPTPGYQDYAAPNGSWDWNCDGWVQQDVTPEWSAPKCEPAAWTPRGQGVFANLCRYYDYSNSCSTFQSSMHIVGCPGTSCGSLAMRFPCMGDPDSTCAGCNIPGQAAHLLIIKCR